jgi:hypothetical protein
MRPEPARLDLKAIPISTVDFRPMHVSSAEKPSNHELAMMRWLRPVIVGLNRVSGDLSCATIFEQSVQRLGRDGEAARRDRLLPTGHR